MIMHTINFYSLKDVKWNVKDVKWNVKDVKWNVKSGFFKYQKM